MCEKATDGSSKKKLKGHRLANTEGAVASSLCNRLKQCTLSWPGKIKNKNFEIQEKKKKFSD